MGTQTSGELVPPITPCSYVLCHHIQNKTLDSDPNQAVIGNNFSSTKKFKKSNRVKIPAKEEVQ